MGVGLHPDEPSVAGATAVLRDRLRVDHAGRVRRGVDRLAAGVGVHPLAGERHGEHLAARALAEQVDRRVLHRHLGSDVAVDPLHDGVLVGGRALGHEVVHVGRPVLDRRVADPGALLGHDLDDRGVQRVARVDRCRAALHVVHVGALVGDDQRPLELAHVLRVDPEVGLQRDVHRHARRHVDERAARPHRRVQRGELVVVRRDDRPEVLLHEIRVVAECRVHVGEDHTDLVELLLDLVIDDLGLVLSATRRPGTSSPPPGSRACPRCPGCPRGGPPSSGPASRSSG